MVDMRGGFAFSVGAHALILALLIFGLPYFHMKREDPPPMISVELVDMAKDTTTNKVSNANKVKQKIEEPTPAPPTPPPPEQKAQPQPEPELETLQKTEVAPTLKKETIDTAVPELKVPELVEKKETPPPPPKPPEAKKEPPKPAAPSFDSILKNLTKQKVQEPTDQPPVPTAKTPPRQATGAQAALAEKLTASEYDALRRQLSDCWNPPAAVKDAQDLDVEVEVIVNADRTVSSIRIADQARMASDPVFRAAALAAQRAFRMPQCEILNLPPDKYQAWQDAEIHFNPKEMFGQ